jgi:chromate transporter
MDAAWLSAITDSALWQLCWHVALLSGTAIGGGMIAVMPDLHRFVVDTHHWMTSEQFAAAFAMAQASPGPNFLYVSIIGWQVAGWTGALAASAAVVLPPAMICYAVIRIGSGGASPRLQQAFRAGLIPLSAGLMLSGAWVLTLTVDDTWRAALLTIVFVVLLLKTRVHPLLLIAIGATAGAAGLL